MLASSIKNNMHEKGQILCFFFVFFVSGGNQRTLLFPAIDDKTLSRPFLNLYIPALNKL